ncbi:unnamed protein product [Hydatigera taeniaeformis]|uniref:2-(3-amino-3-carboxypropyl)histidine synthase subunit 2 n=1 Tax=Hydatigena taeniaeformis TaxID=6205 RepID=A0A0R3X547_HYDTA|nr:unnamed protein product [Hydatigera taeniaeformis]
MAVGSVCRFDLEEVVEFIKKNGYSRVGLQFPSDLLPSSIDVYEELSERTSAAIAILGDTPFSSCCLDATAGKRWGVEAVIHFGNACLTESVGGIGAYYVFGDIPCPSIDENLAEVGNQMVKYLSWCGGPVLFFYDFRYRRTAKKMADHLALEGIDLVLSEPALPNRGLATDPSFFKHAGRIFRYDKSRPPRCLLYLGECDWVFYSILVSLREAYAINVATIDPLTGRFALAPKSAAFFLRRRYFLMEKVKSAKRIGILVGTFSVPRYLDILARLKCLLRRANKPYTTVFVGRINEPKLMNLPDLDAFVLVACPQASFYDDSNLLVPVVTPFELECVLHDLAGGEASADHPRRWNGLWLPLDFAADILNSESPMFASEDSVVPAKDPEKSVEKEVEEGLKRDALVVRDDANWGLTLAFQDLLSSTRDSWRGLDPALGQTPPLTTIQRGRAGLPTKYSTFCE